MKITLDELNPQVGRMVIEHPATGDTTFEKDGKEIQGVLHVVGYDSKAFVDASLKYTENLSKTKGFDKWNAELAAHKNKELLAQCIVGWEDTGFFSDPYTPENAMNLMTNPDYIWLVLQVQLFVNERANFFKKKF